MFDEENLISLAIFLSLCLSIHNTYFFCEIFALFFAKCSHFCVKFSHFLFLEVFSLFFREVFVFSISQKFAFFRETDSSKIPRKKQNFSHFSLANEMQKCRDMMAKFFFSKRFFLFAGNTTFKAQYLLAETLSKFLTFNFFASFSVVYLKSGIDLHQ